MKFNPELIIFDMDGTILDTLEDLRDSLNYSLTACGFLERTLEEVRAFVGNGIRNLVARAVPDGTDEEQIERVFQTFMPHYQLHCKDKTRPYPGIVSLLTALREKGYLTAVVSNKADAAVQELCRMYFDGLFDFAVGEKEGIRKKPAPDSVFSAMEALHTKNAIYIGDSDVDINTAKNAGLACILVTWGFRERGFLMQHGAAYFADSTEDILEMLQK